MNQMIYQFDEESCALASLRMLASLLTKNKGWKSLSFPTHPPYSLDVLEKEMREYGFDLRFYQSEKEEFSYPFGNPEPFLVMLGTEKGTHMVVVSKIEEDFVTILDPAEGKKKMKTAPFLSLWTGCWGVMEEERPVSPPKQKRILPVYQQILTNALLFLAELALGFALAFLDKAPIWFSGSFMVASLLLEESRRILLLHFMRLFDRKWISSIYDEDIHRMKENYRRYNALKKSLFADAASLISMIGATILIAVIVSINTPSFCLSLGATLSFLCGEKLISYRFIEKKKQRLAKEEELLFLGGEEPQKRALLHSLSIGSDRFGRTLFWENAIEIAFAAVFSFLPSILDGDFSLNFYLFHAFALFACMRSASSVFEYAFSSRERIGNLLYFQEYFAKGKG